MTLDRYLSALKHYWYVAGALVLAGIFGTVLYLRFTRAATAVITVAVLEPAVTNNLDGEQAQVNFASVVESRTVSERVVENLGFSMYPDDLQSNISVELSRTLIPSVASPLYTVEVRNSDPTTALSLAEAVVEEAGVRFQELNTLDLGTLNSITEPREQQLRDDLANAYAGLLEYEEQHQAWLLPVQIEQQMELLKGLRESIGLAPVSRATRLELEAALIEARTDLNQLYELLPEYERLSLDATLAIDRLLVLSDAKALRDFVLRPSSAPLEIEDSIDQWQEARNALLDYLEQSEPGSSEIAAAVPPEIADAYDDWVSVRTALVRSYATREVASTGELASEPALEISQAGLIDLPERLSSQEDFVRSIQFLVLNSRVESLGYEAALATEEARLDGLLDLLPDYQVLASRVAQVEIALELLAARKAVLIFEESLPAEAQIKVVDPAHLVSDLLGTLIPIALSLAFSTSTAVVAIYLLAYFVHIPFSAEEVEQWLGIPVLVSLPSGFSSRRRKR